MQFREHSAHTPLSRFLTWSFMMLPDALIQCASEHSSEHQ